MESFAFELKLVDAVTATSKRMVSSVSGIQASAKKTAAALDFSKELTRSQAQLNRLKVDPAGYKKLIDLQKQITDQRKVLKGTGNGGLFSWASPNGSGRVFSAALGEVMAESFMSGIRGAVDLFTGGIKNAFAAASGEETQRIGERNILGIKGGKGFRSDIQGFDKMTPFDDGEIRKMMLSMRKAGMSQGASKQAFATATDLGGGDEGAVSGMVENFRKLYTKHGATKKQLLPILEEAGLSVPDFYAALGKKLKISAKAAEKKAEGDLDPQLAMNLITQQVNQRQGGEAGTGGKRFADSLAGQWKKVMNLPNEYYKNFVDSPMYDKATKALSSLLTNLDPQSPNGQRVMASLEHAFEKVMGFISEAFTPEHIDSFVSTVSGIGSALVLVVSALADMARLLASLGPGPLIAIGAAVVAMTGPLGAVLVAMTAMLTVADKLEVAARALDINKQVAPSTQTLRFTGKDFLNSPGARLVSVKHGPMSMGDFGLAGAMSRNEKTTHVHSNMTVNIHGGDPAQVKQAVIEGHQVAVSAHERAGNEGG